MFCLFYSDTHRTVQTGDGVGENMIPGAGGGGGALDWLCSGRLNQADPNGANQTWFLEGPVGA